jgi:hypothetical protein
MLHPETPASYESLPAHLATQIPTLWIHTSGGEGGGSDIRSMLSIRPISKCQCPPLLGTLLLPAGQGLPPVLLNWLKDAGVQGLEKVSRIFEEKHKPEIK